MKVKYFLEYLSKETGKGVRADLGNNINFVRAAVYAHLTNGDQNIIVIPTLEDGDDDINIINLDNIEVRLDEIPEQKEPAKPN